MITLRCQKASKKCQMLHVLAADKELRLVVKAERKG